MKESSLSSQQKANKASVASKRKRREELKAEFLAAIEAGSKLTQTGVVAPRTYQVWRRDDPEFSKRVDEIVEAQRQARLALPPKVYKYKRKSRAKVYGPSVLESLNDVDIYVKAASMIKAKGLTPDVRESAISELVLMMLSGEEPDAGKAVNLAKSEFLPHGRYYEGDRFED